MATTTTTLVNLNSPQVIPWTLINSWGALTVPAYWCAMNFLSKNLARLPRQVRKGDAADDKHALAKLLNRKPNHRQNAFVFWQTLYFHLSHRRNGYAKINRSPLTGKPLGLYNVNPDLMLPYQVLLADRDPNDETAWLQFYFKRDTKEILPASDVLHLQGLSYDGMAAMDPQALHEGTLQRAATIDKYQTKFLVNGTVIRGVVEHPEHLTTEQAQEFKAAIKQQFGIEGDDEVLILWDKAVFKNATLTPEESQMDKQASYSIKDISRITDVPAVFLHDMSDAKYNDSAGQAGEYVAQFTLGPIVEMAEAELSLKLLTEAEQDAGYAIKLSTEAMTKGSYQKQVETESKAVDSGMKSKNEGRAALGLPASNDPDADKLKSRGDTSPQPAKPSESAAQT